MAEKTLPHYNNRHMIDNLDLIETAIVAFKLNLLEYKDMRQIILAFDLIVKHYVENTIHLDTEEAIKAVLEGMRFINKVISPNFIIDWCLRCYCFLRET